VPPGDAAASIIRVTSRALSGEMRGLPIGSASRRVSANGSSSPSLVNTVYARATCSNDTAMPWPYDIVACSIGFHCAHGRSRPLASPGKPVCGARPKPSSW